MDEDSGERVGGLVAQRGLYAMCLARRLGTVGVRVGVGIGIGIGTGGQRSRVCLSGAVSTSLPTRRNSFFLPTLISPRQAWADDAMKRVWVEAASLPVVVITDGRPCACTTMDDVVRLRERVCVGCIVGGRIDRGQETWIGRTMKGVTRERQPCVYGVTRSCVWDMLAGIAPCWHSCALVHRGGGLPWPRPSPYGQ